MLSDVVVLRKPTKMTAKIQVERHQIYVFPHTYVLGYLPSYQNP